VLLIVASLVALASASSAPKFCKCTCFKNSTIVPLGPQHETDQRSSFRRASLPDHPVDHRHSTIGSLPSRAASQSCSGCTKAFCLSQGINFCRDAKEDDVVAMCFQRDSNKDKIIVWGFIFATMGLLGWAAFKRVLQWQEARNTGHQGASYTPIRS